MANIEEFRPPDDCMSLQSPDVSSPTPLLGERKLYLNNELEIKQLIGNDASEILKTSRLEYEQTNRSGFWKLFASGAPLSQIFVQQTPPKDVKDKTSFDLSNVLPYASSIPFMLGLLYFSMLLIMTASLFAYFQSDYYGHLSRLYILLGYSVACCATLLCQEFLFNSFQLFSLYSTVFSFLLMVWFTQPIEGVIILVWILSFLLICAQTTKPQMSRHVVLILSVSGVLFVAEYALLFYLEPVHGNRVISIAQAVSYYFITIVFFVPVIKLIRSLIEQIATEAIETDEHALKLRQINLKFENQLKRTKTLFPESGAGGGGADVRIVIDMDSPLTKIIQLLRQIGLENSKDPDVTEALDYVVELLSSPSLLKVNLVTNLQAENVDSDIKSYINNLLENSGPVPKNKGEHSEELNLSNLLQGESMQSVHAVNRQNSQNSALTSNSLRLTQAPNTLYTGADDLNRVKQLPNGSSTALLASDDSSNLHGLRIASGTADSVTAPRKETVNGSKSPEYQQAGELHAAVAREKCSSAKAQEHLPGLAELLEQRNRWDFPIFELEMLSAGKPLFHFAMSSVPKFAVAADIPIDSISLANFFQRVENSYQKVPYHNSTHAADVMHSLLYFFENMGLHNMVTPEEMLGGLLAAAIHDMDHPGFNNAFMVNSNSAVALRYNDKAVLENYHCASAFEFILGDHSCNIFAKAKREQFKAIRGVITSMVLATDMASHFEYVGKFKNKISGTGFKLDDAKDRQLILEIAIKCADISNQAKPSPIAARWADLITEEFFRQGDEEKQRKMPISNFMDRDSNSKAKCNLGFIDYIVKPLYEVWDTYMNEDGKFPALYFIEQNRSRWKDLAEQQERQQQGSAS